MLKINNTLSAVLKIFLAVVLLVLVIWLCTARDSFTARTCVERDDPAETVSAFFDALTAGDYEACDALLYNYSSLGLAVSGSDTAIGAQLSELLSDSFEYQLITGNVMPTIVSASDIPSGSDLSALFDSPVLLTYSDLSMNDVAKGLGANTVAGKQAVQSVALTYLDIPSMSDDLHDIVTEVAYNYAYESIDINNEQTAMQVVSESIEIIRTDIEKYYRTDVFIIELEYVGGEWKIVLADDLYNAIIGNLA